MDNWQGIGVDAARLWRSIHEMAEIGPGVAGGNNRQALTDADAEARALLARWGEAAGLALGVDAMGSMFLRREGTDPDALPVAFGSHLDTQPTGGRYDGPLGVLAGLEILRRVDELGLRTRRPLMLVNWTDEEGSRFAPPMLASGVHAGMHDLGWAHDRRDADGLRFGDELARIGWRGEETPGARRFHAFYELHIEQGPILEAEGIDIGIVTHGQGFRWVELTLTGRDSHTGSTPMPMRRDASLGAARIVERVHAIAMARQPHAVGAVGHMVLHPNSRNIIAGRAVLTADLRSPNPAVLAEMEAELAAGAAEICAALGLGLESETVGAFDPVAFDEGCVAALRRAADRLGYSHRDLVSGAGHDACWIARAAPTAMVMCPCVGGLSHNEAEEVLPDWAEKGANVLMHAVLETAGIVG